MKRALWVIAILVLVGGFLLAMTGCPNAEPEGGVPAGVTVTIPEGL